MITAEAIIAVFISLVVFCGSRAEASIDTGQLTAHSGVLRDAERYIDDSFGFQGYFTSTPAITLPRGSYTLAVGISCDTDSFNLIETSVTDGKAVVDPKVFIPPCDGELLMDLRVSSREATLVLETYYQYGVLSVRGVRISQNTSMGVSALLAFILVCALADIIILLYTKGALKKGGRPARVAFWALAAVVAVSSLPLLKEGIQEGHDLPFHLMRLEGAADALRHGQIPARVYPYALNGYGYACGAFYPDLLLYPAALLRLCGVPLQACCKLFILYSNVISVICGYFGFKAVFNNRLTGVAGAALTTLSSYRLVNVWLRSAYGEQLAVAFFPLVLAALWLILREPIDSPDFKRGALFGVIGYSGIIQSHIISCELIALFTLAFCALSLKRVFEKRRLRALLKTAGLTLALNAWFIVPLLDLLRSDYGVNSASSAGQTYSLANEALFPSQLFELDGRCSGLSNGIEYGALDEMPFGVGLLLLAGVAQFVFALAVRRGRVRFARTGMLALGGAAALMFTTTCLFPWEAIVSLPIIGSLASVIQFPWRLLSLVALLLSFTACAGIDAFNTRAPRATAHALLVVATTVQLAFFFSAYTCNYSAQDALGVQSKSVGNGEYLPAGCDISALVLLEPAADGAEILDYEKDGLKMTMRLKNSGGGEGSLTLPVVYYPGYTIASSTNDKLDMARGDNSELQMAVPAGFAGDVTVRYTGRALWRVFDVFSLAAIVGTVYYLKKKKTRPLPAREECSNDKKRQARGL